MKMVACTVFLLLVCCSSIQQTEAMYNNRGYVGYGSDEGYSKESDEVGHRGHMATGYYPNQQVNGGYNLNQQRNGGYNLNQQRNGGHNLHQQKSSGYNLNQQRNDGHNPNQPRNAGQNSHQQRNGGYSEEETSLEVGNRGGFKCGLGRNTRAVEYHSDDSDTSSCESIQSKASDIKFMLYTSPRAASKRLITNDKASVESSSLWSLKRVVVVVHGYLNDIEGTPWMGKIKDGLLKKEHINVILVDWWGVQTGRMCSYIAASCATQLVGEEIAKFLKFLQTTEKGKRLTPSKTQIIGFSLGAHVAGIAGKELNKQNRGKLSRITGLDPAGPNFSPLFTSEEGRLGSSDAIFVDVIHTSTAFGIIGQFGFNPPLGHVDFFMNGGKDQKGCMPIEGGICDHSRATEYYIESLTNTEPSYGYRCDNQIEFVNGECLIPPGPNIVNHNTVGYGVKKIPAGMFFSNTQLESPFLTRSILIELTVGKDSRDAMTGYNMGSITVRAVLPNRINIDVNLKGDEDGMIFKKLVTIPVGTKLNTISVSAQYDLSYAQIVGNMFTNYPVLAVDNIYAYDAYEDKTYCVSGRLTLQNGKPKENMKPTEANCVF